MSRHRSSPALLGTALLSAVLLVATLAGCSSSKSDTTSSTVGSGSGGSGDNTTWCKSVDDLIQQSGGGGISIGGSTAALSQALVSLSANAPSEIAPDIQTLATASQAAVEAKSVDPSATLPQATQDQVKPAWDHFTTWTATNCSLTVPPLVP